VKLTEAQLREKVNDLRERLEALYEEAKEAEIGFAGFLDTCDGGILVRINGRAVTQENEKSSSGFELVEYWLVSTETGEAVLQLAIARKLVGESLSERVVGQIH